MVDITAFSRRLRRNTILAATLFFGGAAMLVIDFTTRFPTAEKGEFAAVWVAAMAISGYFYYHSLELPQKEIMALAEARNGLLTVSEITTALNIDPDLARRTLHHLQNTGIAAPRWEELQKNLWEFPDYMKLPIAQTIDFARKNKGRITLRDLVAQGHSLEVAKETLDTLTHKGLAQADPQTDDAALISERQ